jgi:hypothetical protein
MAGLNRNITISFLIVGHTKFSPDWCFGLFKQVFRRTKVGCLDDIVKVVESSAVVNHAQLVGTQDGQVLVDWAEHFNSPFRQTALKGIKAMHHLTFSHLKPGTVTVKDSVTSPEREINLLADKSWKPKQTDLPPVIHSPGLSLEGQQYLFEKIRVLSCRLPRPCLPETDSARALNTSTA